MLSFEIMVILDWTSPLMNDDALDTGENVYKIASEPIFFVYICVENIRFFSNLNIIYIVDKSLFVGTLCPWLGS